MAECWTKLTAKSKKDRFDDLCAVMCMLDSNLMIEDYSDVTINGMYGDLIDESILNADKDYAQVSIFISEENSPAEYASFLKERIRSLDIDAEITLEGVCDEDWAES